jgi:hypothetical protein
MALAQADRSHRETEESPPLAEDVAALEALAAAAEVGPPAWDDVLARAAALPPCACREASRPGPEVSPNPAFIDLQEDPWRLPIRSRRTT